MYQPDGLVSSFINIKNKDKQHSKVDYPYTISGLHELNILLFFINLEHLAIAFLIFIGVRIFG